MNLEKIAKRHTTEQALIVVERCKRWFTTKENEDISVLKQELAALEYYNKIQDRDTATKKLFNYFLAQVKARKEIVKEKYLACPENDRKVALAFLASAISDCLAKVKTGENK